MSARLSSKLVILSHYLIISYQVRYEFLILKCFAFLKLKIVGGNATKIDIPASMMMLGSGKRSLGVRVQMSQPAGN